MIEKLEISDFLVKAKRIPIIDVRTPAEFAQGHIPNAYNIPLFTDDERVVVGTKYKQANKEAAVLVGLEFVGPKLVSFVKQATKIAYRNEILVHCWRGGMRSGSMAWLLDFAGIKVSTLIGGYKSYRQHIREDFQRSANCIILSGTTGSGKTEILKNIEQLGEQVIDLEGIAHHKGSAFGALGQEPQPSNEHFENLLAEKWRTLDFTRPIWIEDESEKIGNITICQSFFKQMQQAKIVQIVLNKELRIKRLVNEYACFDTELLKTSINKIAKRLGGLDVKLCMEAIDNKDFATVADLTLNYYDKAYNFSLDLRKDQIINQIHLENDNPMESAKLIVESV